MDIKAWYKNKYIFLNITYVVSVIVFVAAIIFRGTSLTSSMQQIRQPAYFITLRVIKY